MYLQMHFSAVGGAKRVVVKTQYKLELLEHGGSGRKYLVDRGGEIEVGCGFDGSKVGIIHPADQQAGDLVVGEVLHENGFFEKYAVIQRYLDVTGVKSGILAEPDKKSIVFAGKEKKECPRKG
jgi:hypothetical protein